MGAYDTGLIRQEKKIMKQNEALMKLLKKLSVLELFEINVESFKGFDLKELWGREWLVP